MTGRTAMRDEPHMTAVALDARTVAVIVDLVEPIVAAGCFDAASGNTKPKDVKHTPEIGVSR